MHIFPPLMRCISCALIGGGKQGFEKYPRKIRVLAEAGGNLEED